ncbi:M20 family metallopeptidase [Actinoallomurus liliacearum]|uniref:M20 family metallopeptidase n=1 Tax=Actinoallomurus liliacearum TaxID=1080073 RepID=A0ABP8TNT8_9ACTN
MSTTKTGNDLPVPELPVRWLSRSSLRERLDDFLALSEPRLVAFRHRRHRHPEPSGEEFQTTAAIAERLRDAGLDPKILPGGNGLICDIVGSDDGPTIALRADIDALRLKDECGKSYASTVPGVAHACGHDVHTTVVLGTGLFLAEPARLGLLRGRVRLIFQPAEENGTGALKVIAAGGLKGVDRIFAVHCDPKIEVGEVGLTSGPITSSMDRITVRLKGPGGHSSRPYKTVDLGAATFAVGHLLPTVLRSKISFTEGYGLTWTMNEMGTAANVIPDESEITGTLRCLGHESRKKALGLLDPQLQLIAALYGAKAELECVEVVPSTVNEPASVEIFRRGVVSAGARDVSTEQSEGGEDFSRYLAWIPGALARLGVRTPGSRVNLDLHRGDFDVDERCIGVGVRVMVTTTLTALGALRD